MNHFNSDINNNNHSGKKTADKSKIYRRFASTVALSAVLLLLTAIAVASPYTSLVVSGQLSPMQATGGNETSTTTAPSGASVGPETGGANATTTAGMQSACLSQNTTTTTTTTPASGINSSATTSTGNTTTTTFAPSGASIGSNDTTTTGGATGSMNALAINQTAFQAKTHVQEACTAIQNNDTQGALTDLNLAIKSIDNILSNLTSSTTTSTAGANQTSSTNATTGR
jgi:hypothetical protein